MSSGIKEEGHHHLSVELTHGQAHRAHLGHAIEIKAHQFGKGHLFVHHENHEKLKRAAAHGRGVRIHLGPAELMHTAHHHMTHGLDGTGFWGKLWKGIKTGYNWLKDHGVLTAIADKGAQAISSMYPEAAPAVAVGRQQLKKYAGFGVGRKEKKHELAKRIEASGLYLS